MNDSAPSDPTRGDRVAEALDTARQGPPRLRDLCADLSDDDARRKPGVGKLSALEHVMHMLGMERDVFAHRMHLTLGEDCPRVDPVIGDYFAEADVWAERSLSQTIEEFTRRRAANVALVEGTGPEEWERAWLHPEGKRREFVDLVREWAGHDEEHLRQLEILARNSKERNL